MWLMQVGEVAENVYSRSQKHSGVFLTPKQKYNPFKAISCCIMLWKLLPCFRSSLNLFSSSGRQVEVTLD